MPTAVSQLPNSRKGSATMPAEASAGSRRRLRLSSAADDAKFRHARSTSSALRGEACKDRIVSDGAGGGGVGSDAIAAGTEMGGGCCPSTCTSARARAPPSTCAIR
eukprot:15439561-Alexandrium_andersonii.AAC.1